ncbi:MAG: hypothetical protein ACIAQU_05225 [Phycisphaerales bacterium JB064]
MLDVTIRWTLYIVALVVVGPIAGMLMELTSAQSGAAGTPLVSASPVLGVIGLVLGMVLATGIGALSAWRCGLRPGLTCAGITLCWMAGMSSGLTSTIVAAGHGPWWALIIEGVLVAIGLIGLGVALAFAAQHHTPSPTEHVTPQSSEAMASEHSLTFSPRSLAAIGVAAIGGAAAAWVLAVTDLRGQVIAAAALSAIAIGLLIKLVDIKTPAIAALAAAGLLAIASPAYALVAVPADTALAAAYAQTLPGLVLVTPLDWAAGVLLGTPIGLAWAASIVKRAES